MTDWYLWLIAAAAAVVATLSWRVPRATMWLALQALSFCGSGWWHDAGLPYAEFFGASTDLAIVCALYAYAILLYELIFWACFVLMLAIDFLFLTHLINSHFALAVGLEFANWLALISIGAAGIADRAGIGRYWMAVLRARPGWTSAVYRRAVAALADLA